MIKETIILHILACNFDLSAKVRQILYDYNELALWACTLVAPAIVAYLENSSEIWRSI
jgi:hypothetical protein